jgi:hypothetical protein
MAVWDHDHPVRYVLCVISKVRSFPVHHIDILIAQLQGSQMDQDYGGMVSAPACSKCSPVSLQVAFLLVIDTLNTVFDIGLLWRYTITLFGELWVSFWFVFSALSYWLWQAATRISTILTGVSETSITCPSDDNNNHAFCSAVFSVGEYQMCAAGESDSDVVREFPHRTDYDGTSSLTYHSNLGSPGMLRR